ncbi:hypothetical protein GCM10010344_12860 [Streptomyces bluensis]|nr:hypothetical protein GCM10010344_12860 [Streptomyces bluensis]
MTPGGGSGTGVGQGAVGGTARVVHEDVDPGQAVEQAVHGIGVPYVHGHELRSLDRLFGGPPGADDGVGTRLDEGPRDPGADTTGASGDEGELAPEPCAALLWSCRLCGWLWSCRLPGWVSGLLWSCSLCGVIHRLSRGLPFAATFDSEPNKRLVER